MQNTRDALTPENLAMLQSIAETGSFAAAARQLGVVPSALTYRVRQIEDALDVLLFDRSARHARPTDAGMELLREGFTDAEFRQALPFLRNLRRFLEEVSAGPAPGAESRR